jgi:ABC-2 type transport system permease protein
LLAIKFKKIHLVFESIENFFVKSFQNNMKKYWVIVKIMWERALVYRFTIAAYRIGEIAETLILIVMWTAVYGNSEIIRGYSLKEMITYYILGNLIDVIVRNWSTSRIADEIKNGQLSISLVKPIEYFWASVYREIGRLSLPMLMSFASQLLVVVFFLRRIIINMNIAVISVIILMTVLAFIIELLISYLVGLIAFWTDEVDGIYTSIGRLRKFFAGGYFPLNLLPLAYVKISYVLPFAYSFFVPTQLYLNKLSLLAGFYGLGVQLVWIAVLYVIIKIVWNSGLKKYESIGI